MKKNLFFVLGILLVLTAFSVSGFSSDEDEEGNSLYIADGDVFVPSINIQNLFILQPQSEPQVPELGMIYFDYDTKRLKFYDGTGWYAFALEKVSSVSEQQVVETIEKKGEAQTCEESIDCGEWGDCINNYQSMTCITMDSNCNKYTDTETKDCVSKKKLKSSAKDSHKSTATESETTESAEETSEEPTTEETEVIETVTSEPQEECSEVCEEVCETAETCEEVCTEEESCSEECSGEGEEEVCEEVCETAESCEEICEPGEETCEEICKEVCQIPEELFDITFDLEEASLSQSDKLIVWITLQNFGKKYVPARLVYSVTDEIGNEAYRKFEEVRVYTDESIIKKFDDMYLEEGNYILTMRVEYAGIVEEFSDDFSVESGILNSIKRFFTNLF